MQLPGFERATEQRPYRTVELTRNKGDERQHGDGHYGRDRDPAHDSHDSSLLSVVDLAIGDGTRGAPA
jgi:hypothetical protein